MSTPADKLGHEWLEEAQLDSFRDQRLQMGNQLNIDQDRAMRSLAVGQYTGLAIDLIDANLEELESELKKNKDFDPEAWKRESPGFADYAAENPYHLSVLKMDNENLTKWERNMRAIDLAMDSTWAKVEYNWIGRRKAHGDHREGDEERLAEYEKLMQHHAFGAESGWAKAVVWGAKEIGPMWYSIRNTADEVAIGIAAGMLVGGKLGAPLAPATAGWSEIAGLTGGAITGAWTGWNVGLAHGGYDMITGEAYNRYIKAGFTHENAAIAARGAGALGAVVEPFGINMLFKYIPGARNLTGRAAQVVTEKLTGQVLAQQSVKAATGKLILRYGEVMASEIMVEIIQDSAMTVGQNILAMVEEKPDAHITLKEWRGQMAETVVETSKAVLLLAGLGPGLRYGGDFVQARRANNRAIAYKALGEAAKDSKLRQAVPAKFREYVDRASGGVENMLLDIDRFETYFQEIGHDPDKVAADLGVDLEEARAFGTDMEIPVAVFAEKIAATEHHDPLAMDFKTDLQQMTQREAKQFLANANELEKEWMLGEPPETHVPNQEIIDRVRNDLMAGGRHDFSAASKLAAIEEHRFAVHAKYSGIDQLELFNRRWGGVQREIDTMGEAVDVDMEVDPLLDLLRAEKGPKQLDIYGMSMVEWLTKKGGVQEQGGELSAMDAALEFPKLIQESGMTHDEAAELAHEAGYLADRDPELLMEAFRAEAAGRPVYGPDADIDKMTLSAELDEMADYLEQNNIDVKAMTNVEIRKALRGQLTLYQEEIIEVPGALPDNLLAEQDFGDMQIVIDMEIAGRPDEIVGVSRSANAAYQTAVNRLRSMQNLLECLNAA